MNITNNFTIHLDDWRILPKLHGVQGDANTRSVKLTLMEGGEAWKIPDDVVASVGYRHENGGSGWYDTLPDGTAACTISGNTVTAVLAPGVFATHGRVSLTVILQETDTLDQIATFPLELKVAANPTAEKLENSYYNYSTMESLNAVATVTGEVYFNGEYHFLQDCTFGELLAAYKGGACVRLLWRNPVADFGSLYTLSYVPKDDSYLVFRGEKGYSATEFTVYADGSVAFSGASAVPNDRTVNGKALSQNITLTAEDVGALPAEAEARLTDTHAAVEVLHRAMDLVDWGELTQGAVNKVGKITYSEFSVVTAQPVYLGAFQSFKVDLAPGWVYTVTEFDTADFSGGVEMVNKSANPRYFTTKPYAMVRFNKYKGEEAVSILPEDAHYKVVFTPLTERVDKGVCRILGIVDLGALRQGYPHPSQGHRDSSANIYTANRLYLGTNVSYNVYLEEGWTYTTVEYDNETGNGVNAVTNSTAPIYIPQKPWVHIRFSKLVDGVKVDITPDDFQWSAIFRATVNDTLGVRSDVPENIGVLNAILNAKQCRQVLYTPLVDLPAQNGDFPAGVQVQGLPYSSTRMEQLYVPNNVSLYTFMAALQNPNSDLYTQRLEWSNAETYYGTVCSMFVHYALGIKPGYVTALWDKIPGMELIENQSAYGLKLGDVLWQKGHVRLVTDIKRDSRGRIQDIEVMDAWPPVVRVTHYTVDTFESAIMMTGKHKIYRYRYLYKAKHTPTPIVPVEDQAFSASVTYNANLMGRLGDRFNVRTGVDVVLDVLDKGAYTQYKVTKDEEVLSLTDIPEDGVITLSGLEYGRYAVCLTGETDSEAVEFMVVGSSLNALPVEGGIEVTFAANNGTPLYLGWFTEDGDMCWLDELTAGEVAAGKKLCTPPSTAARAWLAMETEFGIILSETIGK